MFGYIENNTAEDGLGIQIRVRPYNDESNAIEVTCTMNAARGLIRELVFREVREG